MRGIRTTLLLLAAGLLIGASAAPALSAPETTAGRTWARWSEGAGQLDAGRNTTNEAVDAIETAGDLDDTFSGDGKATIDFGSHQDWATGLDIQTSGKIVTAGVTAADTSNPKFAVASSNADGTPDTSFSGDGKVTTDLSSGQLDAANDVVVQPDGRIVAAGFVDTSATDSRFAIVRYNADGTLDTSFSADGKTRADFTSRYDDATGVALLPDGGIVAVGIADSGGNDASFAVALFTPAGDLDKTFGGDGKVTTNFTSQWDGAYNAAVQPDNRIVVTGEAGYGGSNPKIALARYDVDGSLDTSFSGDGMVKFDLTGDEDYAVDVAIQADGRIVAVGGAGSGGSNPTFGLVRLAADGTLDGTFSGDGKLTTDFTDKTDWAAAVAIQADGRIVAAGESGNGGSNSKFALARYNTDGSLDTTFSGDGKVGANFTSGRDAAFGMKIQTDGKIVAAGGAGEPNTTFAVARFLGA